MLHSKFEHYKIFTAKSHIITFFNIIDIFVIKGHKKVNKMIQHHVNTSLDTSISYVFKIFDEFKLSFYNLKTFSI